MMTDIRETALAARRASGALAGADTWQKNAALRLMASKLSERKSHILAANQADMAEARSSGVEPRLWKRLGFGEAKIAGRIRCLGKIEALPDPVGQISHADRRPNGLQVARMRIPLGVILMIYEARPHVTVNAGAFCLKSGNAAILRGGSEAKRCNTLLGELWRESLTEAGLAENSIQVITCSHEETRRLLGETELIDLVIPRGGPDLIRAVSEGSRIPVIKHCAGVCHVYVDETADVDLAVDVTLDSKCLMPEVCNAMETLLVCRSMVDHLPRLAGELRKLGVRIKGCERTRRHVPHAEAATDEDWSTEYLDAVVSIRVVTDVAEAIDHINRYGTHHTDAIVTDSERRASRFLREVDSGVVLVNASTMFCDGESLGMGAEIGISTDRLHARGPMGLEELTTYKHVIRGQGNVMGGLEEWKEAVGKMTGEGDG